jgi:hypothetical protein
LQGKYAIPEDEFKPILDEAQTEVDARNHAAEGLRWWAQFVTWSGFIISGVLALVAGYFGLRPPEASAAGQELEDLLKERGYSRFLVGSVGVLIALTALSTAAAQRLEAAESRVTTSARDLHDVQRGATKTLYDPETTVGEARQAIADVKTAMKKK